MNPRAGATGLLVFEARPFSHLGIPPKNTALISSRVLLYTKKSVLCSSWHEFFIFMPQEWKFLYIPLDLEGEHLPADRDLQFLYLHSW